MNVIFETGNGFLFGVVVGSFQLSGATFFKIRDQYGQVRALRSDEFVPA